MIENTRHNISAFAFVIHMAEDVFYVFCTPMSSAKDNVVIDLWCLENPLFTCRKAFALNDMLIVSVRRAILDIAKQHHIDTSAVAVNRIDPTTGALE
ncbi:MAG: hypothetical protein J6T80_08305 [Paludibacteraceae bacterium]|nr:hypothetical protein [Paludibacteraceae bacterium]